DVSQAGQIKGAKLWTLSSQAHHVPRVPGPRPAGRRTGGPVRADHPESGPRTTVTAISPNSTVSGNRGAGEWGRADGRRGRQQRCPRSARTDSVTTRPLVLARPPQVRRGRGAATPRAPRPARDGARAGTRTPACRPAAADVFFCSFLALHHGRRALRASACAAGSAENFGTRSLRSLISRRTSLPRRP